MVRDAAAQRISDLVAISPLQLSERLSEITGAQVYLVVAVVYIALSFLYRLAFWLIGRVLFVRRRRLGTAL